MGSIIHKWIPIAVSVLVWTSMMTVGIGTVSTTAVGQTQTAVGQTCDTSGTDSLSVRVVDDSGEEVSEAVVLVYHEEYGNNGSVKYRSTTNSQGVADFGLIEQGNYPVEAYTADGEYLGGKTVCHDGDTSVTIERSSPILASLDITDSEEGDGDGTYEIGEPVTISPEVINKDSYALDIKTNITVEGDNVSRIVDSVDSGDTQWFGRDFSATNGGVKQVTVEVYAEYGGGWQLTDTLETSYTVDQKPNSETVSPDSSITIAEGESVTFEVGGSDEDGNLGGVEWYLDGDFRTENSLGGQSATDSWTQTFDSPGTYVVEADVFDEQPNGDRTYNDAAATWTVTVQPTIREDSLAGIKQTSNVYPTYRTKVLNPDYWYDVSEQRAERVQEIGVEGLKPGPLDVLTTICQCGNLATSMVDLTEQGFYLWGTFDAQATGTTLSMAPQENSELRANLQKLEENTQKLEQREDQNDDGTFDSEDKRILLSERKTLLRATLQEIEEYNNAVDRGIDRGSSWGVLDVCDGDTFLDFICSETVDIDEDDKEALDTTLSQLETTIRADGQLTNAWLANSQDYSGEELSGKSQSEPSPTVETIDIPDTVTEGDSFTIRVQATNAGNDASVQTIAVSFPDGPSADNIAIEDHDFPNIEDPSSPAGGYKLTRSAGETGFAHYGTAEVELGYPLVEAGDQWPSGQTNSLTIRVTVPPEYDKDELKVYVKSVAKRDQWSSDPSVGATSTVDQQGEFVYARTVTIEERDTEAPTADAGDDQTVIAGRSVTLDGTGSSDNRGIETYAWDIDDDGRYEQSGPSPSVTYSEPGTHVVTLRVTDAAGNEATDSLVIEVDERQKSPTAKAGDDQTVTEGREVSLDASASSDPNEGDTLEYQWTQTGNGPTVSLSDISDASPSFTAPDVDAETVLTFQVEVSDGNGNSDTDTVDVVVRPEAADIQISDVQAPESVQQGDSIDVTAVLKNSGGKPATQVVEYRMDGTTIASKEVRLNADTEQTVTFEDIDTNQMEVGQHTFSLATENDTAAFDITVEAADDSSLETAVALQPSSLEVSANNSQTISLVIADTDGGVGAYEATVSVSETDVATITDVELRGDPGQSDVQLAEDGSSVRMTAAVMDTDDTGEVTVAEVTVTGDSEGDVAVSLNVSSLGTEAGEAYTVTNTSGSSVSVIALSPVGDFSAPPSDVDGDGRYEDVNGDGAADIVDVQALFQNLENETVQENPEKFDFNDDGNVDVIDAQALFVEVTSE